jgi:hypothetical protein
MQGHVPGRREIHHRLESKCFVKREQRTADGGIRQGVDSAVLNATEDVVNHVVAAIVSVEATGMMPQVLLSPRSVVQFQRWSRNRGAINIVVSMPRRLVREAARGSSHVAIVVIAPGHAWRQLSL